MKLLVIAGVLAGGYCYLLLHTADMAINQTMRLGHFYQHADEYANRAAGLASRSEIH